MKIRIACLIVFSALLAALSAAHGQTNSYEVTLQAGVSATDNIGRAPDTAFDPARDERIHTPGVEFSYSNRSRRWDARFQGSIIKNIYDKQTFKDETLSTVFGAASANLVEERLDWDFSVNHGQQLIDPFRPVTPNNREDVTVLATGPRFRVPVGARTFLTGGATYSDVAYEVRPFDNARASGRLGLRRNISSEKSISVNVGGDRIEYDLDAINPPTDRQNAYFGYNAKNARNTVGVKFGWNRVERDGVEGDGLLIEVDWSREVSARSKIVVNLGSKYSTDGDVFRLNQQLDNNRSGTQDVQSVDDPFRHDYARFGYTYSTPRTRFSAGVRVDNESYETLSALDRDLTGFDVSLLREFSPTLYGSIFGRFIRRDYGDVNREDNNTSIGASLGWKFSQKTSVELRVEDWNRSADTSANDYDELRGSLMFSYTPLQSR